MNTIRKFAFCIAVVLAPFAVAGTALAADLRPETPALQMQSGSPALRAYLQKRATLYLLRTTFDVMAFESIVDQLDADMMRAERAGLTAEELASTGISLLTESSYYLVSLSYLINSGYPAWPQDRPESSYHDDALAILAPLEHQLVTAFETGADPLPILHTAATVYWWTEGRKIPFQGKSDFARADAFVDCVLSQTPDTCPT